MAILALAAVRLAAQQPAPAASGEQPAPVQNAPAANPGDMSIKENEAPKSVVTKGAKDTLSVDFPNEDIRTILRNVADLFELNIVIPDTLQGKASIKLHDVTWRQIFQVVLAPVGYTYVEDNNIIKVVTTDSLQQEPTTTEVFILNYAKASEIQASITPMTDAKVGGKVQVDARANALIITERPSRLNRIRPIITELDKPTQQVMIESKFVETSTDNTKNLGINWTSLSGYGVQAGPFNQKYSNTTGRTYSNQAGATNIGPNIIPGYQAAQNIINQTNAGPTASTTPGNIIGPPFSIDTNTGGRVYANLGPTSAFTNTYTGALSLASTAVFNADQFGVILAALQSDSTTKLVSNPTVVTLNNTDAFINVGQEYPIPSYQFNQQTGSFEVSGFEFKDIGIILKVTPQINSAGFIKLTLAPEVSSISGTVNFGGAGGASIPIIQTRKAITQVTLKDGSTLGIGGLLQSDTVKGKNKVPILGEIPLLGRLFSSDNDSATGTNLLVFITAKTINPEGAAVGEIFDPRVTRAAELQKDDLPGYRDGSDPFYTPPPPTTDSK